MKRGIRLIAAGTGLCLLLLAGIFTVNAQEGDSPDDETQAEYMGSVVCSMCHTQDDTWHETTHARMVQPPGEDTILGDLLADDDLLTITWPDGETRAITADDITYVLGGRYMQRYVSVIERDDGSTAYAVLPVQWNIPQTDEQTGTWTAYHADDWLTPERDWRTACAGCHTTGLDGATAADMTNFAFVDNWQPGAGAVELSVGCEACHGPGSEHQAGQGTIVRSPDAAICGQCHIQGHAPEGDQAYPVGYLPGQPLDESVFIPAPLDDETVWWASEHASVYNQYGEWLNSRHGQGMPLPVADCVRCHGTMNDSTDATPDEDLQPTDSVIGVTCTACHNPHPVDEALTDAWNPQAMLKTDTYTTCVNCHNSRTPEGEAFIMAGTIHHPVQEMFEGWTVVEEVPGIPSTHFRSDDGPECVTCHMPKVVQIGEFGMVGSHTMAPLMPGDASDIHPDACSDCHGDVVSRAGVQALIDGTQAKTEDRITAIGLAMGQTSPDWMKTAITFVKGDNSRGIHNPTYTDALLDALEAELGLGAEIAATVSPEELGVVITPDSPTDTTSSTVEAEGGLTTPSIVLLAIAGLIILVAGYAFFLREGRA